MAHWWTAKHILGVLILVRYWPSRRYIARLRADLEQRRRHDREVDAFLGVTTGAAKRIAQSAERLRSR